MVSIELTNAEKAAIVEKYIKDCVVAIYNYNLDLIAENATESPDQTKIQDIDNQISRQNARKAALIAEYETLSIGE
jgi:hypothetical protein